MVKNAATDRAMARAGLRTLLLWGAILDTLLEPVEIIVIIVDDPEA